MKTIVTSIAVSSLFAAVSTAQQQPLYKVIDLGTSGGAYSLGFGINNAGEIARAAATTAQTDGFAATAAVWRNVRGKPKIKELGVLGPPLFPTCPTCNSGAAASGSLGEVAMGSEIGMPDPNGEDFGQWDPPTPTHRVTRAAIWRNGSMISLSQPAEWQQRQCLLDESSGTDQRCCREWHAGFNLLTGNAISGTTL